MPAPSYLFKIDESAERLDSKDSDIYHKSIAKCLWLSQRSSPDLHLSTRFYCTQVMVPTLHDKGKFIQMVGYICKTRFLLLIISIGKKGDISIYIDGEYAVHVDGKGHYGLYLTMGRGAMMNMSKKLGVVTNSSTEIEIVSTRERFPKCTWFRYFRIAQGDEAKEDLLMQDNESTILMHKNYLFSNKKGSKHINFRYFFVVDKINQKEVKIVYCPTAKMIPDYSSKPMQGALFEYQHNTILGIKKEDFAIYKD